MLKWGLIWFIREQISTLYRRETHLEGNTAVGNKPLIFRLIPVKVLHVSMIYIVCHTVKYKIMPVFTKGHPSQKHIFTKFLELKELFRASNHKTTA
jgi:hypothetical protein